MPDLTHGSTSDRSDPMIWGNSLFAVILPGFDKHDCFLWACLGCILLFFYQLIFVPEKLLNYSEILNSYIFNVPVVIIT